jgi:hypothetical protein
VAATGRDEEGATPMKNPTVTIAAAERTFTGGEVWVCTEETRIVKGITRPLAI